MADTDDKEKAEKLAAARKRYEQLKKQKKGKEDKTETTKKKKKDKVDEKPVEDESKDDAAATTEVDPPNDAQGANAERGDELHDGEITGDDAAEDERPGLSIPTRMRSGSTKNADADGPLQSAGLKSPPLPSSGEENDAVQDVYKRQRERIHALEEENKRLQKDVLEKSKIEQELEELRDKQASSTDVGDSVGKNGGSENELAKLGTEVTDLKRQLATAQQAQKRRASSSNTTKPEDLSAQVSSKQSTIETLELDISNLRHTLYESETKTSDLESRVSSLTADLENSKTENTSLTTRLETMSNDHAAASSLDAKPDSTTDHEATQKQLGTAQTALANADSTITNLTKKIETLQTLHRDSETRTASQTSLRLKEMDRLRTETASMRNKLRERSHENARLRANSSTSSAPPPMDENGLPLGEDGMKRRIRDLEAEVFEWQSGAFRERKRQLSGAHGSDAAAVFDDVDLSSPGAAAAAEARARRASPYGAFSNIISTFTGGGSPAARRPSRPSTAGTGRHVGFMSSPRNSTEGFDEKGGFLEDDEGADFEFNEEAFAQAQAEEAKARLERVKDVKRGLNDWKGWRMDLVNLRGGAMAGVFEV